MPFGGPTPATKFAGRALCIVSYVLCIIVACGDLVFPSATIVDVTRGWTVLVAVGLIALSGTGLLAVTFHYWRVEWTPATALFFLLLARAAPVWTGLLEHPTRLSAAAGMTLGAVCLGKRALDLWRFDVETRRTNRLAQEFKRDY